MPSISCPLLQILPARVAGNGVQLTVSWAANRTVFVQACVDLAAPVWTSLATNTPVNGTSSFSDPQWMDRPVRYYRATTNNVATR